MAYHPDIHPPSLCLHYSLDTLTYIFCDHRTYDSHFRTVWVIMSNHFVIYCSKAHPWSLCLLTVEETPLLASFLKHQRPEFLAPNLFFGMGYYYMIYTFCGILLWSSSIITVCVWGVTSYIWHSTDAKWPPFSALPGIRLAPFLQQKVYEWPDFSGFLCERPYFSDISFAQRFFRLISAFVVRANSSFFLTEKLLTSLHEGKKIFWNVLISHRIYQFRAIQPFDLYCAANKCFIFRIYSRRIGIP